MPSWSEILTEITSTVDPNTGIADVDGVRRKYLQQLHGLTGRSTVLYATDWLNTGGPATSINLGDMQGLMEVFHQLPGPNLDLILHSPGGQAEATDRLVRYMRSKFSHVRVFIPMAAMSAATMWAMAADEIVMGKHSQLGPIDPQLTMPSNITVPAGALLDQFEQASEELVREPARLAAWLPILQQYPPGLLNICESASQLSVQLVAEWLETYMLKGKRNKRQTAENVAQWLGNDKVHLSHGRAIDRDQLRAKGVRVTPLEDDQALQDAVLSVHHATMHTLSGPAIKLIENHLGRAFVLMGQQMMIGPMVMPPGQVVPIQNPPPGP